VTKGRFAPETEAAFYYCCLEAVQNAFKHAGPEAQARVRVFTEGRQLMLEVRDGGPGFDPAARHDGIGLQSMHDRLEAVGGHVEIHSQPGHGTVVTASAPVGPHSGPITHAQ
jgi:signal transduction histidine kinase